MLPIEIVALSLQAYIESIKLILVVIQDMPAEERRKAWERWFKFWDDVVSTLKPAKPA